MSKKFFEGKKLLILHGNNETFLLVQIANEMGILTIVASSVPDTPSKLASWKGLENGGMYVP